MLVIWAATGHNRPYAVPSDVTAKVKKPIYYVRYGTSSIEAKDELLDQLRDMVNRVPFDDRGNEQATLGDLSPRATITTNDDRTFFLIDIPCHLDFLNNGQEDVQENGQEVFQDNIVDNEIIANILEKLVPRKFQESSKKVPRSVQVMSKKEWNNMALCLQRCQKPISAYDMLHDWEDITIKYLKKKYLHPLLEMGLIEMTIPDQPTNRNQKYILTEAGKNLLSA